MLSRPRGVWSCLILKEVTDEGDKLILDFEGYIDDRYSRERLNWF